jgi:hypothetical protein
MALNLVAVLKSSFLCFDLSFGFSYSYLFTTGAAVTPNLFKMKFAPPPSYCHSPGTSRFNPADPDLCWSVNLIKRADEPVRPRRNRFMRSMLNILISNWQFCPVYLVIGISLFLLCSSVSMTRPRVKVPDLYASVCGRPAVLCTIRTRALRSLSQ